MVYPHEEPDNDSDVERLAVALGHHNLFLGYPEERNALAGRLVAAGFVPKDIDDLVKTVSKNKREDCAPILMRELKDPAKARIRIDDVRKCEAAKNAPNYHPDAQEQQPPDAAALQRMAYSIVKGDRKTPAFAAGAMGVTVDQINQWVDQQRLAVYEDAPPEKKHIVEDTRTDQERLDDFREFCAAEKAKKEAKSNPTFTPKIVTGDDTNA